MRGTALLWGTTHAARDQISQQARGDRALLWFERRPIRSNLRLFELCAEAIDQASQLDCLVAHHLLLFVEGFVVLLEAHCVLDLLLVVLMSHLWSGGCHTGVG